MHKFTIKTIFTKSRSYTAKLSETSEHFCDVYFWAELCVCGKKNEETKVVANPKLVTTHLLPYRF